MNRLTTHLALSAVSAMVAAGVVLAIGSSDPAAGKGPQAAPPAQAPAYEAPAELEKLERRVGEVEASISRPRANDPSRATEALLGDLDERVSALEIEPRDQPPADSDLETPDGDRREHERLSMEELKQRTLEAWYARLDAHDDEERDPAWASETSSTFARDIEALSGRGGLQFLNTDCKSVTCTATVGFDNYDEALTGYQTLLHHDYGVNCAREVLLPEPEDVGAPYVATVLYDCSASRL
jgi:hypothetical protein